MGEKSGKMGSFSLLSVVKAYSKRKPKYLSVVVDNEIR